MQDQHTTPQISAIVCSRNNARSLEATLRSLTQQQLPPSVNYEVLVVDNDSSDGTAEVAQRFVFAKRAVFRYVMEKRLGLSFARNRGTADARGEIVAFLDDDAVAHPDWLAQLWETYQKDPRAACVGGKVELRFPPHPLPVWYDARLDGFLSARDLPYLEAKSERDFPHGTNISFRRSTLRQVGGFHPLLGARRIGNIKLQGDETQLCLRLLRAGMPVIFQPAACVVHVVEDRRLRKGYFLGLAMANGYVRVILDNNGAIGVSTFGQLCQYAKRWFRRWLKYRFAAPTLSPSERFWTKVTVRMGWGSVWYCLVAKHQLRRL